VKYISIAVIRSRRIAAHPSENSFDRPRRIADACGRDHLRRDLRLTAAKTSHEIPGREPIVFGSLFDAAACAIATAANATMHV
jgi:hypothetical protein